MHPGLLQDNFSSKQIATNRNFSSLRSRFSDITFLTKQISMKTPFTLFPALFFYTCLLLVLPVSLNAQPVDKDKCLLETTWGGTTLFNKYNPANHSPGCHSMALAQIFYYHKLQLTAIKVTSPVRATQSMRTIPNISSTGTYS